jgi:hypothetical protein
MWLARTGDEMIRLARYRTWFGSREGLFRGGDDESIARGDGGGTTNDDSGGGGTEGPSTIEEEGERGERERMRPRGAFVEAKDGALLGNVVCLIRRTREVARSPRLVTCTNKATRR